MKRSSPIPGVHFLGHCSGCGKSYPSIGTLMNHVKYDKSCTPEMRFWGKIRKTETCWIWLGAANTTGYGMVSWKGAKNIVAHRLAYRLTKGEIPEGMEVCHTCDTTRCCNPEHLFLGTHEQNMRDCTAKDRHARGERNTHSKLTDDAVREIRREYRITSKRDSNAKELAAKYGVGPGAIVAIIRGDTWKHVK